jgi:hypothetical protein
MIKGEGEGRGRGKGEGEGEERKGRIEERHCGWPGYTLGDCLVIGMKGDSNLLH